MSELACVDLRSIPTTMDRLRLSLACHLDGCWLALVVSIIRCFGRLFYKRAGLPRGELRI